MKLFTKILLVFLSLLVCGVIVAGGSPGTINPAFHCNMDMLIAAPLAAVAIGTLNVENLKIPIAEFEQLKTKYGKLYVIDIKLDEDEIYQFVVRRPTRDLLSALAKHKDDIDKANDLIIKNMVVAGDKNALDDGLVYARLMKETSKIIEQGSSFLSKA